MAEGIPPPPLPPQQGSSDFQGWAEWGGLVPAVQLAKGQVSFFACLLSPPCWQTWAVGKGETGPVGTRGGVHWELYPGEAPGPLVWGVPALPCPSWGAEAHPCRLNWCLSMLHPSGPGLPAALQLSRAMAGVLPLLLGVFSLFLEAQASFLAACTLEGQPGIGSSPPVWSCRLVYQQKGYVFSSEPNTHPALLIGVLS